MDSTLFAAIISFVFGGGLIGAVQAYRKTGPEIEAISVTTLRGVIEELREELERKDRQLGEQNRIIGSLRMRVEKLEEMVIDPPSHMT